MLQITIPPAELWDEKNEIFITSKGATLKLEHSLISISNWEMKWHMPYFDEHKTEEQALDYIRCMTLNKELDPSVYLGLTPANIKAINEYMQDEMTATKIKDIKTGSGRSSQSITSELIYYWMIQFGIPFTCEKWHINRLIMLIQNMYAPAKPLKILPWVVVKPNLLMMLTLF